MSTVSLLFWFALGLAIGTGIVVLSIAVQWAVTGVVAALEAWLN